MTVRAFVGLGSNLGDRLENIVKALQGIAKLAGTRLEAVSAVYETAPWGVEDQPAYLNCVAQLDTGLPPESLLCELLDLELRLGRVRVEKWGARVIDLDLLLYGDEQMTSDHLTLPHPYLTKRAFVLVPLAELVPDLVVYGVTVREHLSRLARRPGDVVRFHTQLSGMPPHDTAANDNG
jgi:2-amino-4-hydroxy-6-hydroxymethyldihydropteridine diphosphokinase